MNYQNKVVWITGASSGIGRSLCLELDKSGARLILSARNKQALQAVLEQCQNPERHSLLAFDLTETERAGSIVTTAWAFNQGIDILFNNGGISQRSLAIDTQLEVDRRVMEVDYFGAIAITKALMPKFIEKRQGCIVSIASVAGKIGSPMRSAYSGAKHALIGFMDCLRAELIQYGIRVVVVCPGFVHTAISKNALTGDMSAYAAMDKEIAMGMSADKFASILLKKLNSNKNELIIAQGKPYWGYQLRRLFPNFYHWLLPKIYRRKS